MRNRTENIDQKNASKENIVYHIAGGRKIFLGGRGG
jgi:hypothetical protein